MKSEHTTYLHRPTDPAPDIGFSHAAGRRVDLASGKYLKLWQGPQHPGITGNMSLEVTLHGDEVVDLKTHVGYLHRGFEKLMERRTFPKQSPPYHGLDAADHVLLSGNAVTRDTYPPEYHRKIRTMNTCASNLPEVVNMRDYIP